jgi:hypothetical protein
MAKKPECAAHVLRYGYAELPPGAGRQLLLGRGQKKSHPADGFVMALGTSLRFYYSGIPS